MKLQVYANIGAEEGERCRSAIDHPAAAALARAFISLFSSSSMPWLRAQEGLYPWLATADAAREAKQRRLRLAGPSVEAVARVHDKAFVHREVIPLLSVDDPASHVMRVFDADELDDVPAVQAAVAAHLEAHAAWFACGFVLKPRWGTSGRGRVRAAPGYGSLEKLQRRKGFVLEPWLKRQQDFSVQLLVPEAGAPQVLATTRQDLRPAGVYLGNHGVVADDGRASAGAEDDVRLLPPALVAARAAQAAGFVGPCGIDAFAYRGPDGREHLRAVVEVNARCTGGTVLAARVFDAVAEGRAQPGDRFAYRATHDELTINPPREGAGSQTASNLTS